MSNNNLLDKWSGHAKDEIEDDAEGRSKGQGKTKGTNAGEEGNIEKLESESQGDTHSGCESETDAEDPNPAPVRHFAKGKARSEFDGQSFCGASEGRDPTPAESGLEPNRDR